MIGWQRKEILHWQWIKIKLKKKKACQPNINTINLTLYLKLLIKGMQYGHIYDNRIWSLVVNKLWYQLPLS